MSDRIADAKPHAQIEPSAFYDDAYHAPRKSVSELNSVAPEARKGDGTATKTIDFAIGDPYKELSKGAERTNEKPSDPGPKGSDNPARGNDVSAPEREVPAKSFDAAREKPAAESSMGVPDVASSDENYRGHKPEDDYKQHTTYEKDKTVVVRTGDKPENNFTLTLNTDGTYIQEFKDGRKIEGRKNPDGSSHVKSTGSKPEDNFEADGSADGRKTTVKFADGRAVTINSDDRGNTTTIESTGPDSRDNFTWNAETGKFTHATWGGAILDPLDIHGNWTATAAFNADIALLTSGTEATDAFVRRLYRM